MVDIEYLKRCKEEIEKSSAIYSLLTNENAKNMVFHMQKAMLYLADAVMERHIELSEDLNDAKKKMDKELDEEFFETYFLISNMAKKEIKILSKDKAIISGKNSYKIETQYFGEMIKKIISYFNKAYAKAENGDLRE